MNLGVRKTKITEGVVGATFSLRAQHRGHRFLQPSGLRRWALLRGRLGGGLPTLRGLRALPRRTWVGWGLRRRPVRCWSHGKTHEIRARPPCAVSVAPRIASGLEMGVSRLVGDCSPSLRACWFRRPPGRFSEGDDHSWFRHTPSALGDSRTHTTLRLVQDSYIAQRCLDSFYVSIHLGG